MALDQAGVELIAKNYRDYTNQLKEIDRLQQQVFKSTAASGAKAGHEKAGAAAKKHSEEVSRLQSSYRELEKLIIGALSVKTLQQAFELARGAFDFRREAAQFENLTASMGGSANEFFQAFMRGAGSSVGNARGLSAAMAALRLEVVKTPAEMEEFVRLAVALRPAGKSAADAVDELTVALGRKSLRVLDNFNVSSDRARIEMEKMSQTRFGVNFDDLDDAAQSAIFVEAAIKALRDQYNAMGADAVKVGNDIGRLTAAWENLGLVAGEAIAPGAGGLAGILADAVDVLRQLIVLAAAGAAGFEAMFSRIAEGVGRLDQLFTSGGFVTGVVKFVQSGEGLDEMFSEARQQGADAYWKRLEEMVQAMGMFGEKTDAAVPPVDALTDGIEAQTAALRAQKQALMDQLRTIEDGARIELQFRRASEDALRKHEKERTKLLDRQSREEEKLFADHQAELADLEKETQANNLKEREAYNREIKKAQDDLNRQLKQAQERFDLDRLQARRRFSVDDRRLRAEGDILALINLREDFALQQQEAKENHELSQRQTREGAEAQIREQERAFQERAREMQAEIEERRQQLVDSFDKELEELRASHAEQRDEQAAALAEQFDQLRLNRQRQLEDLGRNLAQQQGMTRDGAQKIANELETAFGEKGIADQIMTGFTDRTTGSFAGMFEELEAQIRDLETRLAGAGEQAAQPARPTRPTWLAGPNAPIGMQHGFQGVVTGPQTFQVEPGVREFVMAAPLSTMAQSLNVTGGATFRLEAPPGTSQSAVDEAIEAMTRNFEVAVRRMVRR